GEPDQPHGVRITHSLPPTHFVDWFVEVFEYCLRIRVDGVLPAEIRPGALRVRRRVEADHRCSNCSCHVRGSRIRTYERGGNVEDGKQLFQARLANQVDETRVAQLAYRVAILHLRLRTSSCQYDPAVEFLLGIICCCRIVLGAPVAKVAAALAAAWTDDENRPFR